MTMGYFRKPSKEPATVKAALGQCRSALLAVALFSCLLNVLALTGSVYMLQVYDRVLPSHSVPTLIGLTLFLLVIYASMGTLDTLRSMMTTRIGIRIERVLRRRVLSNVLLLPLRTGNSSDGTQLLRDLEQIRTFLSSAGPTALFDLPWMPFYLCIVYFLHPWLGLLASAGAVVLVTITVLTDVMGRLPSRNTAIASTQKSNFSEITRRNAESLHVLGMTPRVVEMWDELSEKQLGYQVGASDTTTKFGSLSKIMRQVLQSLVLGLGAYLVIEGQASGGVMIASSILVSRALAPVELAIANWRGFIAARQGAARLTRVLQQIPERVDGFDLPAPERNLSVEGLTVAVPGQRKAILQNVSFALKAGDGLGIIGPSGSGKSTLARALVGAWLPAGGKVRLDGAALDQWAAEALGPHIGYLSQSVELFDGTVSQNIARFDPDATSDEIIEAAKAAAVHDLIVRLPQGYDTVIGAGGEMLSAGQRQRVGLARALYRKPFVVVLDEPNSNLDAEGDQALTQAIKSVRERGGIVVVIAHRPSALAGLDLLLVLANGQAQAFGPKDDVLKAAVRPPVSQAPAPQVPVSQPAAPAPLGQLQLAPMQQARLKVIGEKAGA